MWMPSLGLMLSSKSKELIDFMESVCLNPVQWQIENSHHMTFKLAPNLPEKLMYVCKCKLLAAKNIVMYCHKTVIFYLPRGMLAILLRWCITFQHFSIFIVLEHNMATLECYMKCIYPSIWGSLLDRGDQL